MNPESDGKGYLNCPGCSRRLRVPIRPGAPVEVRCPICKERFSVEAGSVGALPQSAGGRWLTGRRLALAGSAMLVASIATGLWVSRLGHPESRTLSQPYRESPSPPIQPPPLSFKFQQVPDCPQGDVLRPRTSAELGGRHRGGLGRLRVMNGTAEDAVAVLVQSGVPKRAIYVRTQEEGIMTSIPVGEYHLHFQRGSRWLNTRRFCDVTTTSQFAETFDFYETEEDDGTRFKEVRVSLHAVPHGNARTITMSADLFGLPPEENSQPVGATALSP
jgi:hypothetical protein